MSRRKKSKTKDSLPSDETTESAASRLKSMSRGKRWLFRLMAIAIPLLLFGVVELGLRAAGVGKPLLLTEHVGDSTFLATRLNPAVDQSWYGQRELGGPVPHRFDVPKPKDVFRVLVVGGSTVLGFPYDPALAFPARMEAILQRELPDRNVEVLNCGVIAVNSLSVLDMVRQSPAVQPDLIVVHTGHNEFYGPGGVGSNAASVPAFLFPVATGMRRSRLFQLLQRVLPAGTVNAASPQASLPASVEIGLGNSLFAKAEVVYRNNLRKMSAAAQSAKIPILFTTVSSNIRDHSPVSFLVPAELNDIRLREWSLLFDKGRQLSAAGEHEQALELFGQAEAISGQSSLLHYRKGKSLDAINNNEESMVAFSRARDLDGCRFRAPSSFRDIVQKVASRQESNGVYFLDTSAAVKKACEPSVPGYQLYYEHVHYNEKGHSLLASAISRFVVERLLKRPSTDPPLATDEGERTMSMAQPFDHVSALTFAFEVMNTFPMTKTFDANMHKHWLLEQIQEKLAEFDPDIRAAFDELSPSEMGFDLTGNLAKELKRLGSTRAELRIRRLDVKRKPWSASAHFELADCLKRCGNSDESRIVQESAMRLGSAPTGGKSESK